MKEALLAGLIIANPNGAAEQFPEALCTPNKQFCITGITACSIADAKQSGICAVVRDNKGKISTLIPLENIKGWRKNLTQKPKYK